MRASMINIVVDSHVLDEAYDWLCARRVDYPAHDDVWDLRINWSVEKARVAEELLSGCYRFLPQRRTITSNGEMTDIWAARDALVLKALTVVLSDVLPLSTLCTHIKGNGGLKRAVGEAHRNLADNRFALRTDVKSYYASIDHTALMDRMAVYVRDKTITLHDSHKFDSGFSFWPQILPYLRRLVRVMKYPVSKQLEPCSEP